MHVECKKVPLHVVAVVTNLIALLFCTGCKEAADIVGTTDSRQEQADTTEQSRLRMDQDSLCAAEGVLN